VVTTSARPSDADEGCHPAEVAAPRVTKPPQKRFGGLVGRRPLGPRLAALQVEREAAATQQRPPDPAGKVCRVQPVAGGVFGGHEVPRHVRPPLAQRLQRGELRRPGHVDARQFAGEGQGGPAVRVEHPGVLPDEPGVELERQPGARIDQQHRGPVLHTCRDGRAAAAHALQLQLDGRSGGLVVVRAGAGAGR
jgi:hypothetical protein